jgi:APA family basic amino acid/polyamine antiporter
MSTAGRIAIPASEAALIRAIGLFGLTAAIVNVTVGGGIYRLPAAAARGLGPAAPLAYIACAAAFVFIVICFAEAASRVSLTGGIYAYVEIAFGPLVGLATGLLLWASCTSALAAVVSFLGDTLAALVPGLGVFGRAVVVLVVLGASAVLNYRGVRLADRFNSIATMVKVAPLLILLVGGVAAIDPANLAMPEMPSFPQVAQTSAILIFAFLGVETALVPSGEVKDPERTVPRAVILAIVAVAILYLGLHLVAQGVLGPGLGEQKTPLAEAAGVALGGWARQAVLGASVLSMLIYASGMMLGVPRLLFAVARDGFAPPALAAVHPAFHTPHVAIVVQAVIVAALAISGTFERLALIGNAAALLSYAACCAAAWQLRRRDVRMTETRYDVPGGGIAPPIALLFIAWLLTGITAAEWIASAVVVAVAAIFYATQRRRPAVAPADISRR